MKTRTSKPRTASDRRSERGLTLAEALVAITVFAIVFISALTLYSVASSSYLRTDAAVIQQQNVRFTMDKMTETLRDAGAGHNMLGNRKIPDEQIEGIWESAVFVRGDFDGEREGSLAAVGQTTNLENTTYPIVTVGNDEIVGFVVRKAPTATNPTPNNLSITIKTDLTGTGRDAVFTNNTSITGEETATIAVAATTVAEQTDPPYQLTRVTFTSAGVPQYEVIAENVNQVRFTYATLAADVTPTGSADGPDRATRASIRRIGVRLVGMSDRRDLAFNKDAGAGTGFRTFPLETTILAANLGVIGGRHNFMPALSLGVPASITTCTGHCRQHLVKWDPVTAVTTYSLQITADAVGSLAAYDSGELLVTGTEYEFEDPPDDIASGLTRPFTFRVAATSGVTIGAYTTTVTQQAVNDAASVPNAPGNVAAVGSATENAMTVTWEAVTHNTGPVTATSLCVSSSGGGGAPTAPWNIEAEDLSNSKVFRVRSNGSNTGADAVTDVSTQTLGTLQNAVSNTAFLDRTAAPCSGYFYRVKACDLCDVQSAFSTNMGTPSSFTPAAGVLPAKPPAAPTPVTPVNSDGVNYTVQLQWNPVITTSGGQPAAAAHYVLERWTRIGAAAYTKQAEENVYESTTSAVQTLPMRDASSNDINYRFMVRAVYDCSPARDGALSDPYDMTCSPPASNTLTITQPANADVITRPSESVVPLSMTVGGTGWTGASMQIQDAGGAVVYTAPSLTTPVGSTYSFTPWNVSSTAIPDGIYTVTGSALVNGTCRVDAGPYTFEIETVACGQRIVSAAYTGNGNNFAETMTFRIENTCPNAVTINQFTSIWNTAIASARVIELRAGATTYYTNGTGVASGQAMPFSQNLVLAAGTVATPSLTPVLTFTFNDNFTSDGTRDGATGRFTSILGRIISPSSVNEQLIDGVPSIP